MNKLMITLVSSLLLAATGTALAQDNTPGERENKVRHQQRGAQVTPAVTQLMRALKRLDLNDEQREAIRAIRGALKADVRPIMKGMKAGQLQLKELVNADSYDEAAVAVLAGKEGDLTAERILLTSRALSGILGLLTDEQRAELEAMAAQRKEKRAQGREQRSGKS